MSKILWHAESISKTLEFLKTTKQGLSSQEAAKRLQKNGTNSLPQKKGATKSQILLNQFTNPLVYVLLGASVIALILQDYIDALIIAAAVLLNTLLGFYQENKANNALDFLKKLVDRKAKVLRDGNKILIDANHVVPGDIIYLDPGDKIPADARLIKTEELIVIEAALTGEASPITKQVTKVSKGAVIGDRTNMVFSGTVVAQGKGMAIVCATGVETEIGKISTLVNETEEQKTPLQQQLKQFSTGLTYFVLGAAILILIVGSLQGREIISFGHEGGESMFTIAAAIAVAAIPEGLLAAVTAVLAIGMQAILRRQALVRKLVAAETLGSTSIICTDKTGTLTEGIMSVAQIITHSSKTEVSHTKFLSQKKLSDTDLVLKIATLCNDASIQNPEEQLQQAKVIGSPTEAALLQAAIQAAIPYQQIINSQPRLSEIAFSSQTKFMATLHALDQKNHVIYTKGAPEKIINFSSRIRKDGKKVKLSTKEKKELQDEQNNLTNQGLRVLALAYKQVTKDIEKISEGDLEEMIFLGFIALKDPLRKEAKETIELAQQAGIRPIIITGDHKLTARAIVSELGISVDEQNIIEGHELDNLDDEQLAKKVHLFDIYARVEPSHKLRIIKAWQSRGEVVAMTGDGINDAPALKAADIGVALGSGTDVAKETSDMILLDNNFKTIVAAIERGRVIYDNIKKIILYLLASSFSEIILIIGALIANLPLPLLAGHMIWINLITDGAPGVALTFETGEKNIMKEKPRKKNTKILDTEMKVLIFIIGVVVDILLLSLFYLLITQSTFTLEKIRTIIFASLGLGSLLYVYACRSFKQSIFKTNIFSNKYLTPAVMLGVLMQILAIYQPSLQKLLQTVPLNANDWIIVITMALIKILAIEATKMLFVIKNKINGTEKITP